jgi:hypothetical protein
MEKLPSLKLHRQAQPHLSILHSEFRPALRRVPGSPEPKVVQGAPGNEKESLLS